MRRFFAFVSILMLLVGLGITSNSTASQPEKTLVIRVRSAGSIKPAAFSGTIQFDTSSTPIRLNHQPTPFGIKMKASSAKASFQKVSSDTDLFVELIEFSGEKEVGSITKTGTSFEVDADQSGDRSSLSIR